MRDRLKDIIITGGSNVSAREVEDVLMRHPRVRDAAVFGVPHRVWGEAVTAVIVAEAGLSGGDVMAFLPRAPRRLQAPEADSDG